MGVGAGPYMYDVVVKSSRSLSRLLVSSCIVMHYTILFYHDQFLVQLSET